ncbi:MAG: YggS family pyridoxal phosphate-dependent enzyme, partial [Planctomycetota bacterium]
MRAEKIRENYLQVLRDVAEVASAAGRNPETVRVVAVTKYVDLADTRALVEAGCVDLGESRPQNVWEKAPQLPPSVRWHLIGHLQRNKVRRTLPQVHLLHSLDSMRLTEELTKEA